MRRGFISMKPHFRAFLKNVTKQAVIAAVHLAQSLVNHDRSNQKAMYYYD